jgi:ectoine hydroxylase-related dioxygenase (phytanoyl-CoA dioxygenase family)
MSTIIELPLDNPVALALQVAPRGYAVLGVIDQEQAAVAKEVCAATLRRKNRLSTWLDIEQHRREPFRSIRRQLNTMVGPVAERALGTPALIGGETWIRSAGAGAGRVHRDAVTVKHDTILGVLLFLTDFTHENGATEIWPGSHLIHDDGLEDVRRTEARAAGLAVERIEGPAGTVVLRDHRAWHRSGANLTGAPRIMLTSQVLSA